MSHAWFLRSYISQESMASIQGYSPEQDPGAAELQHCMYIKWHLCNMSLAIEVFSKPLQCKRYPIHVYLHCTSKEFDNGLLQSGPKRQC